MAGFMDYILLKSAEASACAWLRAKVRCFWNYFCGKIRNGRDKAKYCYKISSEEVKVLSVKIKSNIDGIMNEIQRTMSSLGSFSWILEKLRMLLEELDCMVLNAGKLVNGLKNMLDKANSVLDGIDFFVGLVHNVVSIIKIFRGDYLEKRFNDVHWV